MTNKTRLEAHRGVGTDAPENTMPAFEAAASYGYDMIELDLKFTADNQCVVLHDGTVERTGRNANGEKIEKRRISEMTLDEALTLDFGIWKGEEFKNTHIPLFSDVLTFAKNAKIPLKIDNCYEHFTAEQREILYRLIEEADMGSKIGFTCANTSSFEEVAERFPDAEFHYDGVIEPQSIDELKRVSKNHRTTVWIPFPCGMTSWVSDKIRRASKEYVDELHAVGFEVGIWILHTNEEYNTAVEYGADIVETDGAVKPR